MAIRPSATASPRWHLPQFVSVFLIGACCSIGAAQAPDAREVLKNMSAAYGKLDCYHFERSITFDEIGASGDMERVGEITLCTATDKASEAPNQKMTVQINPNRCRLESKAGDRHCVLTCADGKAQNYQSVDNSYMRGADVYEVATSVSGAMAFAMHLSPLEPPNPEDVVEVRAVRQEEVMLDGKKQPCYVLELTLKAAPPPGDKPSAAAGKARLAGPAGSLTIFQMQGLLKLSKPMFYTAVSGDDAPTQATLWIDQGRHIVLRRVLEQNATKLPMERSAESKSAQPVRLRMTETFSKAHTDCPLPAELFTFSPPPGAKEKPNVQSRRQSGQKPVAR